MTLMVQGISKIAATALSAVLLPAGNTQAAEPTMLTFSCDGTIADAKASESKPERVTKMGLIVNFAERSVSGFNIVAHIDRVDDASISFGGEGNLPPLPGARSTPVSMTVMGSIDRVTGAVSATTLTTATMYTYDLLCKPVKRLF
jgi:hypothetical protein